MKSLVASLLLLLATLVPAYATATITCQSDMGATLYIQAAILAEMSILGVDIVTDDQHWSSHAVEAEPIEILQSFVDAESIRIDVSDANIERIVARVRLFVGDEGSQVAMAGTLHIPDVGIYAIICEGP